MRNFAAKDAFAPLCLLQSPVKIALPHFVLIFTAAVWFALAGSILQAA